MSPSSDSAPMPQGSGIEVGSSPPCVTIVATPATPCSWVCIRACTASLKNESTLVLTSATDPQTYEMKTKPRGEATGCPQAVDKRIALPLTSAPEAPIPKGNSTIGGRRPPIERASVRGSVEMRRTHIRSDRHFLLRRSPYL